MRGGDEGAEEEEEEEREGRKGEERRGREKENGARSAPEGVWGREKEGGVAKRAWGPPRRVKDLEIYLQ